MVRRGNQAFDIKNEDCKPVEHPAMVLAFKIGYDNWVSEGVLGVGAGGK